MTAITLRKRIDDMVVSRFQARAALHLAGLLEAVEAAMADPAMDPIIKLAWTDAREFRRASPAIAAMTAQFGWSDAQVDQLFVTARGIEV